jgi:hypothetical protein
MFRSKKKKKNTLANKLDSIISKYDIAAIELEANRNNELMDLWHECNLRGASEEFKQRIWDLMEEDREMPSIEYIMR